MKNIVITILLLGNSFGLGQIQSQSAQMSETVRIAFPVDPSTGLVWRLDKEEPENIVLLKSADFKDGNTVFTFKAHHPGTVLLTFHKKRIPENDSVETKMVRIAVQG